MRMGLRHSIILSVSLILSAAFLPAPIAPFVMMAFCIVSLFYGIFRRIWPDVTLSAIMIAGMFVVIRPR